MSTGGLSWRGKATLPLPVFSLPTPQLRSQREQPLPLQRYPSLHVHSASLFEEHSFKYLNLPGRWKRVLGYICAQAQPPQHSKGSGLLLLQKLRWWLQREAPQTHRVISPSRLRSQRRDKLTHDLLPQGGHKEAVRSHRPVPSHFRQRVQLLSPAALENVSGGHCRQAAPAPRPQPALTTKVPAGRHRGWLPRGRA